MISLIVQISRFVLLVLIGIYMINAFMIVGGRSAASRRRHANSQMSLILIFNIVAFLILYLQSTEFNMILLLGCLIAYIVLIQLLYRLIYRTASLGLLNNMCMLMSIGFVIQARLDLTTAFKQMIVAAVSSAICLMIPVFIRKVKTVRNMGWFFAIGGILLLGAVFAFSRISRGANLSLQIGGISFQFSEFVKITFVFFIASMLARYSSFKKVVLVSVLAALHVGILVISRDLGAALIYFIAYIVMVYVATRKPGYALIGLGGMAVASVAAYRLFAHVRVRVQVWRDPFQDYEGTGYQIVQALFGVCAGGWFGTGLFNGNPEMIPLAKEDFTFAAICEEFGVLFAIFLILLCMCTFLLIVNISTKLSNPFYRLVSIGLGTEYAFQVFLTVGGTTKFIPMTGITLPLVSYGGSSMMCTIIMLSIIQGLYMIREDEDEEKELLREIIQRQNERERRIGRSGVRSHTTGGNGPASAAENRTSGTRVIFHRREPSSGGQTRAMRRRTAGNGSGSRNASGGTNRTGAGGQRTSGNQRADRTRVIRSETAGNGQADRTRVIRSEAGGKQSADRTRVIRSETAGNTVADQTRVIRSEAGGKQSADQTRVIRSEVSGNRQADQTKVIRSGAAGSPKTDQTIAFGKRPLRKSSADSAGEEPIDIVDLEKKIEDETEKSLNY